MYGSGIEGKKLEMEFFLNTSSDKALGQFGVALVKSADKFLIDRRLSGLENEWVLGKADNQS